MNYSDKKNRPLDSRAILNNVNDNERVLKNSLVGPVDNVDNSAFNRAEDVEKIVHNLVITFGSEDSYRFYCKVAYALSEQRIKRLIAQSLNGKNPGGLFNWLCRREMSKK